MLPEGKLLADLTKEEVEQHCRQTSERIDYSLKNFQDELSRKEQKEKDNRMMKITILALVTAIVSAVASVGGVIVAFLSSKK